LAQSFSGSFCSYSHFLASHRGIAEIGELFDKRLAIVLENGRLVKRLRKRFIGETKIVTESEAVREINPGHWQIEIGAASLKPQQRFRPFFIQFLPFDFDHIEDRALLGSSY